MLPRCNWRQRLAVKVQTTDYSQKIQLLKLNLLEVPSGKVESTGCASESETVFVIAQSPRY